MINLENGMGKDKDMGVCLNYFQSRSVYKKLFEKMQEKYAGLGHFGGRIALSGLTEEEKEQLGGFLQRDYTGNQRISISMKSLQKALETSRFSEFTWEEILKQYFGGPLVARKEVEQGKLRRREAYFLQLEERNAGERGKQWFSRMRQTKGAGYSIVIQQYNQDRRALEEMLKYVFAAVEKLPVFEKKTCRLPVFAAQITGNPHFFDAGSTPGRLLLYFIQDYFPGEEAGESQTEKRNGLLYRAGILNDDLSNCVLTYGLRGRKDAGGSKQEHPGLQGYYQMKEPVSITLFTLQGLEQVWGNETIYVVENPAVFSMLIEKYPGITAICTNGQLRLSALLLMDKLCERSVFYYAGDFDPEGLVIAQNLKERYKERLVLWNYRVECYEQMKSQVVLSGERLKKLEKIHCKELQEIKTALQREKMAGYQENGEWEIRQFPG